MNKFSKLAVAVIAAAGLSACASTRVAEAPAPEAATADQGTTVLRPIPSYGSLGGYRYRRFVVARASAS